MNVITTAPPEPPKTRRNAIRDRLRRTDVEPRELVAGAGTALAQATARAYKSGIDRLLTSPERVASVAEANALLESDEHFEELWTASRRSRSRPCRCCGSHAAPAGSHASRRCSSHRRRWRPA